MAHDFSPSTQEIEAGQPSLHWDFQDSQGYTETLSQKKKKKRKKKKSTKHKSKFVDIYLKSCYQQLWLISQLSNYITCKE